LVIFLTAYDEYALAAFDIHALDYLLKAIDEERSFSALERARVLPALRKLAAQQQRISDIFQLRPNEKRKDH
jgi:DNA-binding LytR/AlgR family response regulator